MVKSTWLLAFLQGSQFRIKLKFDFMRKGRAIVFLILISLLISSVYLISCEFDELGLGLNLEKEEEKEESEEVEDAGKVLDISSAEFFLELKSKQKNKNPLSDINIRKAIFYAIDRNKIVEELLGDYGKVLNSLFTEGSLYYFPAWKEYSYDLDKAKDYLDKAGYGVDNPLYITIGASDESSSRNITENLIKEDLKKIGINIWVFNKSSKEWYLDCIKNGDYELGIWALYTYDGGKLKNYFCSEKIPPRETDDNRNCYNYYWYKNEEVDRCLLKISKENNSEKRKELLKNLQDELAQDAIILPLYRRIFSIAYSKKIKNIDIDLRNSKFFANIENWDIDYDADKTEKENKEIVVGYREEPYVLNPLISNSIYTDYINNLVIRGLWERNENGEYEPVLVEETPSINEVEYGKLTLRESVKLKDGIFWQDGSPITSEDVKYTFKSIMEDESINNNFENYKKIKDIEVINEKEFDVIFREYFDDWKGLFNIIFPKSKLEEGKSIGCLFENDIVGCGPYKLKEWIRGEYILLEKNEYYFGKQPKIDNIRFLFNSDINCLISLLKEGEIDILSIPVDLGLIEELEENKDINLLIEQGNLWEHLAICLKPKED